MGCNNSADSDEIVCGKMRNENKTTAKEEIIDGIEYVNPDDIEKYDDSKEATLLLMNACKNGNLQHVSHIISSLHVNPNKHHKLTKNNLSIDIPQKARPKDSNYKSFTCGLPIVIATSNNDLNIIKYLVKCGADINIYNSSCLVLACILGYMNIVKYIVEECKVNINAVSAHWSVLLNNINPLESAIIAENDNIIKYLINNGAKIRKNKVITLMNKYDNKNIMEISIKQTRRERLDERNKITFIKEEYGKDVGGIVNGYFK